MLTFIYKVVKFQLYRNPIEITNIYQGVVVIHAIIPDQVVMAAAEGAMAVAEIVVATIVLVAKFGDKGVTYAFNKIWPIEIRSL